MPSQQFVHVDTRYDNVYVDATNTLSSTVQLDTPIKSNVGKIQLVSLELPIGIYNIRTGCNTFRFNTKLGAAALTAFTATVPQGNYTASTLAVALQTAMNAVLVGCTATITVDSVLTNKISILLTNSYVLSISDDSVLGTVILGYSLGQVGVATVALVATNCMNLNHDLYLSMIFDNMSTSYANTTPIITFKIPINVTNGNILFYNEQTSYKQCIEYNESNKLRQSMSSLKIRFGDRYNNILSNNGLHYSFTLKISYI
jgi:hypothetical protein